ncbi:MAG: type II toxin-antitoxin system VapC family toxin [Desulfobacterales bacterium]
MRFWDSSAIIPLLVLEKESAYCIDALRADGDILIWTMTHIEVFSALCRRLREGSLGPEAFDAAKKRTRDLLESAFEVVTIEKVEHRALRLLQVHPLRAADALQLAAVLVATEENVSRLPIMCFDDRLITAARLEGFEVNPQ